MNTTARMRWVAWRNRVLASERFQAWAARLPIVKSVARGRARSLFDLLAGFTYSQVLLAIVESDMLALLADGPRDTVSLASSAGLGVDAAERLLRAARALDIVEEVRPGEWMLGQQGAVLNANPGAQAMIRHHRLLYADLAEPLALLRADRVAPTALSRFWTYARRGAETGQTTTAYSELMAGSQAMVAREVCAAYDFGRHDALLDIGGGHGRFAARLAADYPRLRLGLFDLPAVVADAAGTIPTGRIALHPGDFFRDEIPQGYDCHTLVRILHDHDDAGAAALLAASRRALPPGGRLVIVEPMAGVRGAEPLAAYFEVYLWAMGSGRPRTVNEIEGMLLAAGFAQCRLCPTSQPVITSVVVGNV